MARQRKATDDRVFVEESALAMVALQVADAMQKQGVSQRDLAARLGVSEARVSQILGADYGITVRSLARLANALGCGLKIELIKGAARSPKMGRK